MSNLKNKYSCLMDLTMDLIGGKWGTTYATNHDIKL